MVAKSRKILEAPPKTQASDRILAVATQMFADRGFAGVTTRQIAKEANVTFPVMYRRFRSKRALYLAACGSVLGRMSVKYNAQARQPGSPEARLLAFVTTLYHDLLTDPCLTKIVQREILDRDEEGLEQLTRDFFASQFLAVKEICAYLVGGGRSEQVTFAVYAVSFGYLQLAPIGKSMRLSGVSWRRSKSMARTILKVILPDIDWEQTEPNLGDS